MMDMEMSGIGLHDVHDLLMLVGLIFFVAAFRKFSRLSKKYFVQSGKEVLPGKGLR